MTENSFRFNITFIVGPGTTPKGLRVKYWFSIKCVTKTKFYFKIMEFVANVEKLVLGSYEWEVTPKRLPQWQSLCLDKPYITTP